MSTGIKNLKEIVDFGMAVEKAGVDILGGGFHPDKLTELLAIIPTVGPAFEGLDQVVPELADLDGAEAAELTSYIVSKGTLPAHAAKVLEKSLKLAASAWDLITVLKEGTAPAA